MTTDQLAAAFLAALEADAAVVAAVRERNRRGKAYNPLQPAGLAIIKRIAQLVEHPYHDMSNCDPQATFADRIAAWRAAYDK